MKNGGCGFRDGTDRSSLLLPKGVIFPASLPQAARKTEPKAMVGRIGGKDNIKIGNRPRHPAGPPLDSSYNGESPNDFSLD
jgi:hypothetical protein